MKLIKTSLLITGLLLSFTPFTQAQDQAASVPKKEIAQKPNRAVHKEKMLERFDVDHDGKISQSEREKAKETRREENFDKRWAKMTPERKAKLLKKWDANKDGKLDESERKTMFAEMKAKRQKMLEKFDTNKDGKLDQTERAAMKEKVKEERKARRAERKEGQAATQPAPTAPSCAH